MSSKITELFIPGHKEEHPRSQQDEFGDFKFFKTKVVDAYDLSVSRNYTGSSPDKRTLKEDEIIELFLDDGATLYLTEASFLEIVEKKVVQDELPKKVQVNNKLSMNRKTRGTKEYFIKGLRFLRIVSEKDDLADKTIKEIAKKLENKLKDETGLFRCDVNKFQLDRVEDNSIPADRNKPILIFIHGTASNTEGSFIDLWKSQQGQLWRGHVEDHYGQNLYAFEHHTLTKSPIDNALQLVNLLPRGCHVHLVTHSRGGLIGELLSRGQMADGRLPFIEQELNLFKEPDPDQYTALKALNDALLNKQITVERFVRVACPARGTTLAGGRLDVYFSILLNALRLIPALKSSRVFGFVHSFLIAVVKKRADPKDLPGLAAMMPESMLIRLLNSTVDESRADLSVIAGKIEEAGLFQTLAVLATDLFFLQRHDLVVNTSSMDGGTPRTRGIVRSFHQGAEVSHFRYFLNTDSVQRLISGLARSDAMPSGYELVSSVPRSLKIRKEDKVNATKKPLLYILPGIFGSELNVKGNHVWIDWPGLMRGEFTELDIDSSGVTAENLCADKYAGLIEFLSKSHRVIPYPIDWRRSVRDSAGKLADHIRRKLSNMGDTPVPVRILAHSTGGLVARAMIAAEPGLWAAMGEMEGSRLVMLGTPNGGTHSTVRLLLGQKKFSKILTLLDVRHRQKDLLDILVRYPGLLETLPTATHLHFFEAETWEKLPGAGQDWTVPASEDLKAAQKTLEFIAAAEPDVERIFYVAGCHSQTPVDLINETRHGQGVVKFSTSSKGDGCVPWDSGRLSGVKTWYMDVIHGDMADSEKDFPALQEILEEAHSFRLPMTAPTRQDGTQSPLQAVSKIQVFPDAEDLLNTAICGSNKSSAKTISNPRVAVSIVQGDLRVACYPTTVGHYEGDSIVSAEAVLDKMLGGSLTESHELGLYPGPINTVDIFFKPDRRESSVIVVGLGRLGTLTSTRLQETISHAMLRYVRTLHEFNMADDNELGISFLLVGSGAGGIPLEDSIAALMRGVLKANRILKNNPFGALRIKSMEFIEVYLDRVVQAAHILGKLSKSGEFHKLINVNPSVKSKMGGKERVAFLEEDVWWQRVQIVGKKDGSLSFTYLTKRARAEAIVLQTQRKLIDQFIKQSITQTKYDAELSASLYELLMPLEFKTHAPEGNGNIQLILDEKTAYYPWELLEQNPSSELLEQNLNKRPKPMSVQMGLIRQLILDDYRPQSSQRDTVAALVVGDPRGLSSSFSELPGAQREAEVVVRCMESQGYLVKSLIREDAEAIIKSLYVRRYRIIHLAGHGVYRYKDEFDPDGREVSGMVLGDGLYLTPKEITQMTAIPDIVFINCCHLGNTQTKKKSAFSTQLYPNKLAANLATQLIKEGVRCVIAAGWAVEDQAARVFAEEFYHQMMEYNESFGAAVLKSRQKVYQMNSKINTWGAYQCYGDPNFRLRKVSKNNSSRILKEQTPEFNFTIPKELTYRLGDFIGQAQTASTQDSKYLHKELSKIVRQIPPSWFSDGTLLGTIAKSYAELGDYNTALRYYKQVIASNNASVSLETLEQYSNIQVRWAAEQAGLVERIYVADSPMNNQATSKATSHALEQAISRLNNLISIAASSDRYSLLGSAYKCRARINKKQRKPLKKMTKAYKQAYEYTLVSTGTIDLYALINWMTGTVVENWCFLGLAQEKRISMELTEKKHIRKRRVETVLIKSAKWIEKELIECEEWIEKAEPVMKQETKTGTEFSDKVCQVNYQLTRCLLSDALKYDHPKSEGNQSKDEDSLLTSNLNSLIRGYDEAADLVGSARQYGSIQENIKFLVAMSASSGIRSAQLAHKNLGEILNALKDVKERLVN